MIGFILLLGSVVSVYLFNLSKFIRVQNYNTYLNVFGFFNNLSNFLFLRKQNVVLQGNHKASLKFFKKL